MIVPMVSYYVEDINHHDRQQDRRAALSMEVTIRKPVSFTSKLGRVCSQALDDNESMHILKCVVT